MQNEQTYSPHSRALFAATNAARQLLELIIESDGSSSIHCDGEVVGHWAAKPDNSAKALDCFRLFQSRIASSSPQAPSATPLRRTP